MTGSYIVDIGMALWLGILTSISPCPLTTNIAAISYIGRKVNKTGNVLLSGLLYTLGRIISYVVVGVIVINGLMALESYAVSNFLQKYMNLAIGPILFLTGLILLQIIKFNIGGKGIGESLQKKIDKTGIWGSLILGIIFALTFCPTSAGLFFGSLIPIALSHQSRFLMPLAYGVGTALPVIVFAVVLSISAQAVGGLFSRITAIEKWARWITGGLFVVIGIYLTLKNIFHVPMPI